MTILANKHRKQSRSLAVQARLEKRYEHGYTEILRDDVLRGDAEGGDGYIINRVRPIIQQRLSMTLVFGPRDDPTYEQEHEEK